MVLLFLESLGTTELLVILVVALVLFGPRKLPEMTRKFGKSLNEFKRASDEFKQTWEREVAMENVERDAAIDRALIAEPHAAARTPAGEHTGGGAAAAAASPRDITDAAYLPVQGANVARGAASARVEMPAPQAEETETAAADETAAEPFSSTSSSRKTDWL